ncbi:hypothetical protein BJ912DRAFT_287284 [Pholiota molesta]|nr:hypothetical protein BJ912DRAFT_287284 [Pholiota molesta]
MDGRLTPWFGRQRLVSRGCWADLHDRRTPEHSQQWQHGAGIRMGDSRHGLDNNGLSREGREYRRSCKKIPGAAFRTAPRRGISRSYGQAAATHGSPEGSKHGQQRDDRLRGRPTRCGMRMEICAGAAQREGVTPRRVRGGPADGASSWPMNDNASTRQSNVRREANRRLQHKRDTRTPAQSQQQKTRCWDTGCAAHGVARTITARLARRRCAAVGNPHSAAFRSGTSSRRYGQATAAHGSADESKRESATRRSSRRWPRQEIREGLKPLCGMQTRLRRTWPLVLAPERRCERLGSVLKSRPHLFHLRTRSTRQRQQAQGRWDGCAHRACGMAPHPRCERLRSVSAPLLAYRRGGRQ